MNWILYGFKGVGKTYFGQKLGLPFLDTDQLIMQKEGCIIREIVQKKGEVYFRQTEKQIIQSLHPSRSVIAVGGGAVLDPVNVAALQKLGHLIYLKRSKEWIKKQMLTSPLPTFIDANQPEESFERMYQTRIPLYEKISSFTLDLDNKKEIEILGELWQVIDSDKSFASQHGENRMAKPSA